MAYYVVTEKNDVSEYICCMEQRNIAQWKTEVLSSVFDVLPFIKLFT